MTTAFLDSPRTIRREESHQELRELLKRLGDIPAERVRLWPPPGTATFEDLEEFNESPQHQATCELVQGTLVEKAMGLEESVAAMNLGHKVLMWNDKIKLGFAAGEAGVVKLTPTQGRAPDFGFYLWERYPGRKRPSGSIPAMFPDFAVEILSKSNTKKEIKMKREEYFAAGTRLVWEVDLKTQTVVVYREPIVGTTFGIEDVLDGGDVLPGFRLSIREWMESLAKD